MLHAARGVSYCINGSVLRHNFHCFYKQISFHDNILLLRDKRETKEIERQKKALYAIIALRNTISLNILIYSTMQIVLSLYLPNKSKGIEPPRSDKEEPFLCDNRNSLN